MNTNSVSIIFLVAPAYVLAIMAWIVASRALKRAAGNFVNEHDAAVDSDAVSEGPEARATQHFLDGNTHLLAERHPQARAEFEAGLACVQQTDNLLLCGRIMGNLGHSYLTTGDFARAVGVLKCALVKAEESDDEGELAGWIDQNLAYCRHQLALAKSSEKLSEIHALISQGELDEAAEAAQRALDAVARSSGEDGWLKPAIKSRLAYIMLEQGRHYDALLLLEEAQEEMEPFRAQQPGEATSIENNLAYCHTWLGF